MNERSIFSCARGVKKKIRSDSAFARVRPQHAQCTISAVFDHDWAGSQAMRKSIQRFCGLLVCVAITASFRNPDKAAAANSQADDFSPQEWSVIKTLSPLPTP